MTLLPFAVACHAGRPRAVIVVASVYGANWVREHGHTDALATAIDAHADGFEIRRELVEGEFDAHLLAQTLGPTLKRAPTGFTLVYSAPDNFFDANGAPNVATAIERLQEARTVGAAALKLQLGRPADGGSEASQQALAELQPHLLATPVRLLLENGQAQAGGTVDDFVRAFTVLESIATPCGTLADQVAMAFDLGNWFWSGGEPAQAAATLGKYVGYIHCKGVAVREPHQQRVAVPPQQGDPRWIEWLAALPSNVPRGLEFPIEGPDRVAATRAFIETVLNAGDA